MFEKELTKESAIKFIDNFNKNFSKNLKKDIEKYGWDSYCG